MYMINNKRKGGDVKPAPTKVVTSLAPDEYPSNDMLTSPIPTSKAGMKWEETEEIMKELLEFYQSSEQEDTHISNCNSLLKDIDQVKGINKHIANEIKSRFNSQISQVEALVKVEKDDLSKHEQYVAYLQQEVESLQLEKETLTQEKNESIQRTKEYEEEASEEVEKQDEIEVKMKESNSRIKHEISNYIFLTGIKWDFNSIHLLEGEFNIPSKNECRRFSVDPIEYDEVQLADKLWETLDVNADI